MFTINIPECMYRCSGVAIEEMRMGMRFSRLTYCGLSEGCSFPLLVASFTKSIYSIRIHQHTSYIATVAKVHVSEVIICSYMDESQLLEVTCDASLHALL